MSFDSAGAVLSDPVWIGSPIYLAGLDTQDRIVSVDGRPVTSESALSSIVAGHRPGEQVAIVYVQRGARKTTTATLAADPTLELVSYERAGMPVTDAMRAFRDSWLGSKVQGNHTGGGAR